MRADHACICSRTDMYRCRLRCPGMGTSLRRVHSRPRREEQDECRSGRHHNFDEASQLHSVTPTTGPRIASYQLQHQKKCSVQPDAAKGKPAGAAGVAYLINRA